jgi:predicted DCC family thiol-disulfide oxidoreductase YuxK
MSAAITPNIVLFDGVCNLCHSFVQFIIRYDTRGHFRFTSLQSATGQALLAAAGYPSLASFTAPDSVVLLQGGQLYTHSAAILHITEQLGGIWRLARLGWLLPQTWRDALYRYTAQHRYQWFGRQASCLLPTDALQTRFL